VNFIDPLGLDPEEISVGILGGMAGLNIGFTPMGDVTVTPENSGLGMFGGDANQMVAVVDPNARKVLEAVKKVYIDEERDPKLGARVTDKGIAVNPVGGFLTSGSHTFQISFNMKHKIGEFVDLEKEQAAAFILAHEAGHVRNKIPRDGHDQFGFISVMTMGKFTRRASVTRHHT
jgi:hypothetical protein